MRYALAATVGGVLGLTVGPWVVAAVGLLTAIVIGLRALT